MAASHTVSPRSSPVATKRPSPLIAADSSDAPRYCGMSTRWPARETIAPFGPATTAAEPSRLIPMSSAVPPGAGIVATVAPSRRRRSVGFGLGSRGERPAIGAELRGDDRRARPERRPAHVRGAERIQQCGLCLRRRAHVERSLGEEDAPLGIDIELRHGGRGEPLGPCDVLLVSQLGPLVCEQDDDDHQSGHQQPENAGRPPDDAVDLCGVTGALLLEPGVARPPRPPSLRRRC